MIKFTIFYYKITIEKKNEKQQRAAKAKTKTTLQKIRTGLKSLKTREAKYSEYALQKETGLSINTIKKYRSEIEKIYSQL